MSARGKPDLHRVGTPPIDLAASVASWNSLMLDTWALGWEASTVIGLRLAKIARGGSGAVAESSLMATEKMSSAMELQLSLVTGGLGRTPLDGAHHAVRMYRRKVRANRRRLSASAPTALG